MWKIQTCGKENKIKGTVENSLQHGRFYANSAAATKYTITFIYFDFMHTCLCHHYDAHSSRSSGFGAADSDNKDGSDDIIQFSGTVFIGK